jgi:translation initiation factor IF-3
LAAKDDLRINKQIRVREVRVIDDEGNQRGVMPTPKALELAQEVGADLVEVAPQANPPVCKILDYGKYKFEQEKRRKESKKKQKQIKLKEIRMQPKIERHDLEFKTKHVKEFLDEGNKVKVTVRFRGREMAHTEIGRDVLMSILKELDNLEAGYNVDRKPQMEGRFMSMILSPKSKK